VNPDVRTRFHHLACAARHQPYKLRSALAASSRDIPDREALERTIERTLSGSDVAEEAPATRDEYLGFVERLREAPDDDLALVFGDWLQDAGDPRGELVAVQHALETADGEDRSRLLDTEKKLLATHRKQLLPDRLEGTLVWRRGFVHRLVLAEKGLEPTSLARVFAHPSFRILRELAVEVDPWALLVPAANLPRPLPPTLHALELGEDKARPPVPGDRPGLGDVAALVAAGLLQLARLKLHGAADLRGLRHASLAALDLGCVDVTWPPGGRDVRTFLERLADLDPRALPSLRALTLRVDRGLDTVVYKLVESPIFSALDTLVLHGDLSRSGVDCLVQAKREPLQLLDIRGCKLGDADIDRLRPLTVTLVTAEPAKESPAPPVASTPTEWLVRHKRRPEWGIGRVLAESDEGLEVEFEAAGKKQIRNVELLEELTSPS
jgi:uncharacterized protein (TIGR02996 family)